MHFIFPAISEMNEWDLFFITLNFFESLEEKEEELAALKEKRKKEEKKAKGRSKSQRRKKNMEVRKFYMKVL